MTRRRTRSDRHRLSLSPEVQQHERAVRDFLNEEKAKGFFRIGQDLPEGCNFQIVSMEPSVMAEHKRLEREAFDRLKPSR